jgi:hypothetical protein
MNEYIVYLIESRLGLLRENIYSSIAALII